MDNSFYSHDELAGLGLKSYGENVLISRFARLYSPGTIEIGSHVRIDDFCILSGTIKLGSHIHISAYSALYGKTDDFSGDYLIGPMVDESLTNVTGGEVRIGRYSQLGAGCVVMPKVRIGEGVALGAMSLVLKDLDPWKIYKGIPTTFHRDRGRKLLNLLK